MRRSLAFVAACVFLIVSVRPVQAVSNPVIDVATFGIELCPQSICGAAIFTGVLQGQVGSNPFAFGTFTVAATHQDLPDETGEISLLTGGVFEFRVGFRRIKGFVYKGYLENNGDNTFTVKAILVLTSGGSGYVVFEGLLNHNVFPPTISGSITQ